MGRPFGIPIYVSPTWFVVAALITWWYAPVVQHRLPQIGAGSYGVAFCFAVLLYLSVLVHELSHSVVAQRYGLPVRRITLYMLGGVSEIEEEPQTPGREFLVAFAGPLLSVVLAVISYLIYAYTAVSGVPEVLVYELALSNMAVGVFNLLPGLPLDGGRILRAGVWKLTGKPMAGTLAAAWAGRILAICVLCVPFVAASARGTDPAWSSVLWATVLAGFIWLGASQSLRLVRIRERLPSLQARRLARRAMPVTADVPLAEAMRRAEQAQAGAIVIVDHEGAPLALVNDAAVRATPDHRRPWITASTVARALQPGLRISADLAGRQLVEAIRSAPAPEYLLVEPDGSVFGVLVTADLDRAFAGA